MDPVVLHAKTHHDHYEVEFHNDGSGLLTVKCIHVGFMGYKPVDYLTKRMSKEFSKVSRVEFWKEHSESVWYTVRLWSRISQTNSEEEITGELLSPSPIGTPRGMSGIRSSPYLPVLRFNSNDLYDSMSLNLWKTRLRWNFELKESCNSLDSWSNTKPKYFEATPLSHSTSQHLRFDSNPYIVGTKGSK